MYSVYAYSFVLFATRYGHGAFLLCLEALFKVSVNLLHVCKSQRTKNYSLQRIQIIFLLIIDSVVRDSVVFYGDNSRHVTDDFCSLLRTCCEESINHAVNRFIVIWQLEGWITQSDK